MMSQLLVDSQTNQKLSRLFETLFSISGMADDDSGLRNENLMGSKFRLCPKDLIWLYFKIEKEFGIQIPWKALSQRSFSTYNNILELITNIKNNTN